jgi:1,4-dihydroxy-2-naphthoate octaprenyltransferase
MSDFRTGLWRLADPKISITSAASMAIGATLAFRDGHFSWLWLAVLAGAMFCMEVAKNAWGDIFDYDSGTDLAVLPQDRTDFSGGKRVLVDNILSRRQTWTIAAAFSAVGLSLGGLIVFFQAPSWATLAASVSWSG